jgi:hypothetical protein
MSLGPTEPVAEITRDISWGLGKGGRRVEVTNLTPSCAVVWKPGNLKLLAPSGLVWATTGIALLLLFIVTTFRLNTCVAVAHRHVSQRPNFALLVSAGLFVVVGIEYFLVVYLKGFILRITK